MTRRALLALGLIFALTAQAFALAGQQRTVIMQPPGWTLPGVSIDIDFANRRYWVSQGGYRDAGNIFSTTRASVKYCQRLDGLLIQVASGVPCITDQGNLVETGATNLALWARDLTNAAWVKVGVGTALNATGVDGTANSATALTATGTASSCTASCTVLQTVVHASSTDAFAVYIKGVTITGAVNISEDGVTWTALTSSNCVDPTGKAAGLSTTQFVRCTLTTAALVNPAFGLQFANLNDSAIVDFGQFELSPGGATSPIATTTVSVTRAADQEISTSTARPMAPMGAYALYAVGAPELSTAAGANQLALNIDDGTVNNRGQVNRVVATNLSTVSSVTSGTTTTITLTGAWAQFASGKTTSFQTSTAVSGAFNNSAPTSSAVAGLPIGIVRLNVGLNSTGVAQFMGYLSRAAVGANSLIGY